MARVFDFWRRPAGGNMCAASHRRPGGAIRALLKLAPKTAPRLGAGGEDQEIALERVQVGDRLRVRPGDGVLSLVGRVRRRRNICVGVVELFCGERAVAEVEETLAWVD